ncbi:hypothetical protein BU15DRAFT_69349 [Melanogaster broomeanus]|nr:hypothetical protein BU15DRAFT_69349 [Melanogaster broomeanus]
MSCHLFRNKSSTLILRRSVEYVDPRNTIDGPDWDPQFVEAWSNYRLPRFTMADEGASVDLSSPTVIKSNTETNGASSERWPIELQGKTDMEQNTDIGADEDGLDSGRASSGWNALSDRLETVKKSMIKSQNTVYLGVLHHTVAETDFGSLLRSPCAGAGELLMGPTRSDNGDKKGQTNWQVSRRRLEQARTLTPHEVMEGILAGMVVDEIQDEKRKLLITTKPLPLPKKAARKGALQTQYIRSTQTPVNQAGPSRLAGPSTQAAKKGLVVKRLGQHLGTLKTRSKYRRRGSEVKHLGNLKRKEICSRDRLRESTTSLIEAALFAL